MFENIFLRKKPDVQKLKEFGFKPYAETLFFTRKIVENMTLNVFIDKSGSVNTKVLDGEEEYSLYKTDAQGAFVGSVRTAVESVLTEIAEKCFFSAVFNTRQLEKAVNYVKEKYGDGLEFLWTKFPDNAVLRRKDNKKWYAVVGKVKKSKLGINSEETVEIFDFRYEKEKMSELLKNKGFYPGWHMNKSAWFTVIADESVKDGKLFELIDNSYLLAGKSK